MLFSVCTSSRVRPLHSLIIASSVRHQISLMSPQFSRTLDDDSDSDKRTGVLVGLGTSSCTALHLCVLPLCPEFTNRMFYASIFAMRRSIHEGDGKLKVFHIHICKNVK